MNDINNISEINVLYIYKTYKFVSCPFLKQKNHYFYNFEKFGVKRRTEGLL